MSIVLRRPSSSEVEGPRSGALAGLISDRSLSLGHRTFLAAARSDRTVSYRSMAQVVGGWTSIFETMDLVPGATVGVAVADPLDFAGAFLAIVASGRFAAPLDPGRPDEGPGGITAAFSRLEAGHVVADRPRPKGWEGGWTDARGLALRPAVEGTDPPGKESGSEAGGPTGGVILASSGTTGRPKIIRLAESQLLHVAQAVAEHHGFTAEDRGFNPLPLFHINAEVVGLLASLVAGSSLILDDRFHRTRFWN